jgi:putative DNA primase/helicase
MTNPAIDEVLLATRAWKNAHQSAPIALAGTKPPGGHNVQLTCASDVQMRPIDWLWNGYLPRGMLSLLAGLPGCGKSTLALALAATVTNAGRWPDGTPMYRSGSVLIWSSEDAIDTTLTPRLLANGADLSKVHFVSGSRDADGSIRPFDPSTDMRLLEEEAANMPDLALLILDPVLSAVGGDSHKAAETRRGLQAVVDMAATRNVAILGISHFRKGGKATDPAERVIGSQAFVALARMVLIASKVEDLDDPKSLKRIIARAKSNISADDGGFEFHLAQSEVKPGIWAQGITWGGAIDGSALALLNNAEGVESTADEEKSARDNAADFLIEALKDCSRPSKEIEAEAKEAGISIGSLRRARSKLKVRSVKSAMSGGWVLELPKALNSSEDAHSISVSAFGESERLRDENIETELEL